MELSASFWVLARISEWECLKLSESCATNHSHTPSPLGKLAPGVKDLGAIMADMWGEMESDRFKYGCKTIKFSHDAV